MKLIVLICAFFFHGISFAADLDPYICMKGYYYAEEGRSADLLAFLKKDQESFPRCLEGFRYKGLLLPHYIVEKKYENVYSALVEGIGPNWEASFAGKGSDNVSLLELAVARKQDSFIGLLLQQGANVNRRFVVFYPDKTLLQALMEDLKNQNLALKVLEKNIDLKAMFRNKNGIEYSPGMTALVLGWNHVLQALLAKGLDPNVTSRIVMPDGEVRQERKVPLVVGTTINSNSAALKALMDAGARLNECSSQYEMEGDRTKICALNLVVYHMGENPSEDTPGYEWLKVASQYDLWWGNLSFQYNDRRSPLEMALESIKNLTKLKLLESVGLPLGPDKNTIRDFKSFEETLLRQDLSFQGYILFDRRWFESLKGAGKAKNLHRAAFSYLVGSSSEVDFIANLQKYLNAADPQYAVSETVSLAALKLFDLPSPNLVNIRWAESAGYDFYSFLRQELAKERNGEKAILGLLRYEKWPANKYVGASTLKLGYFSDLTIDDINQILNLAFHSADGIVFSAAAEFSEEGAVSFSISSAQIRSRLGVSDVKRLSDLFANKKSNRIIMRSIEGHEEGDANALVSWLLKSPGIETSSLQNDFLLMYAGLTGAAFLEGWPRVSVDFPGPADGKASLCAAARRKGVFIQIRKYCEQPIAELTHE